MWFEFRGDTAAPTPRECHSLCAVDASLVLYGGNDSATRFGDVHTLDTESMTWSKHSPSQGEAAPARRSAHAAAVIGGRWLLIFGGWDGVSELGDSHAFDVRTHRWVKLVTRGEPPAARHFHSMAALHRRAYVFGGFDGAAWRGDIVALDLDSMGWEVLKPAGAFLAAWCSNGFPTVSSDGAAT